ncbi:TetR/AcrR family transcriptional regulator [Nocardioides gansuensis]|uniref:TetR/AcrR family transcriptional regulator n=1 Tax=Nocardioides gansuensis TaxID=2138300 RepID=A0A2T8F9U2_9ACTN|nr:TetR family transcriptional regulator [Nocardioides gansuensis]PVG82486.1 TetR/AcrR family transcriptional regulator [Nocardioides gansuensis]
MSTAGRRGRRPGNPETRTAILDAAREAFAASGFRGTTIRGVASAAGVDPALVHHYFGSKDDLFVASLRLPVDPRERLAPALVGGPDGAAERLLRVFLSVWDDPANRLPLLAVVRGMFDPAGHRLLTEGFLPAVVLPIGRALGVDEPERRMPVVASQLIGLIMARYVLELEPIASMAEEEIIRVYAPTIQRYLTGDI